MMEPTGTGVNRFCYFVTNNPFSKWTKLPDLTPAHLSIARRIRHVMTGDLDKPVIQNPFFFGQEKHYLRAQVSRIVHNTTLLPRQCWRVTEDDPRAIEENTNDNGDVPVPTFRDMTSLSSWAHANPNILLNSRTSHLDPEDNPDIPDFDPEEEKKKIEAADPYEPRLKPISLDRPIPMTACRKYEQTCPAWVLR